MADIFSKDPIEENNDNNDNNEITLSFEDLVGEGKKYANPDELAKAYANADGFIQTSKAEKARLEAENKVLKDLAEARKKSNSEEQPKGDEPDPAGARPNEDNDKEDLSAKIAEMMNERDTQKKFTDNVNAVSEKLANHYGGGAKAQKALQDKAAELKVDISWLMDMAGRSPEAFYRTVGVDSKSFSSPNASSGDVNTSALSRNANRRNFKYYEELRKADSKAYYSPHVQRELMKDAREQGSKFYE